MAFFTLLYYFFLAIIYGSSKFGNIKKSRLKPDVLDNPRYGEHKFFQTKTKIEGQSIKIHYVSGGKRDRQVMLFLHGFPENWYSWRHQIDEFSKNYHTVAMNLRGYGESSKPRDVSEYSVDKLVDDTHQLIQHLLQSSNFKKIILVSHDWGAIVCIVLVKIYPELIEKFIVMNGPDPSHFTDRLANDWKQIFSSWYILFFQIPVLPELYISFNDLQFYEKLFKKFSQNEKDIEAYKYYQKTWQDVSAPLNLYRAFVRGYGFEFVGKQKNTAIQPPTIIIWAINDTALVKELAEDIAKQCRQVMIRYIENCSHWVQIERPNETNQAMREFLRS